MMKTRRNLRSVKAGLSKSSRGQSMLEMALLLPVLLIILSGIAEFGFLINEYMTMQDSVRNAARFGVDGLYDNADTVTDCATTRDYYRQIGCLTVQELAEKRPQIILNIGNGVDDVVVSVFTVSSSVVTARHPEVDGEAGWSLSENTPGWEIRNQSSQISSDWVNARLNGSSPNTGLILVEIYRQYHHKLGLPWITAFVPDPITLRVYALMPNSSAEPTSTPEPP
jgi:hypothetical protein